jgi:hypothetical protein
MIESGLSLAFSITRFRTKKAHKRTTIQKLGNSSDGTLTVAGEVEAFSIDL